MNINLDSELKRNPDILTAEIDDEVVMMSADQGQYFGLSAVGVDIWAMTEHPVAVRDIISKLCRDYGVSYNKCEYDTLLFINEMVAEGLMKFVE